jgi:hypothetical protein
MLAALVALAPTARADAQSDELAASALVTKASELWDAGSIAEACVKYAEADRLAPTIARKYRLGECYQNQGKFASAWVAFKEASALAKTTLLSNPQDKRAKMQLDAAQARLAELEMRIPKLSIVVAQPPADLVVTKDGEPVNSALFGVEVATDPGSHTITAKAAGFEDFSVTIDLQKAGVTETKIELVKKGSKPAATASSATTTQPPPAASSAPPPPPPASQGGGTPALTWVLGGVGVASLLTAGVLDIVANNKFSDSKNPGNGCDASAKTCLADSQGAKEQKDAQTFQTVSIIALAAGVVLSGVGVGIWVSSGNGHDSGPRASLVVTPGGLSLVGRF